jgi:hypothetical protein
MPDSLDADRIATSQLVGDRNRIVVDARDGKLKPDFLTVREAFRRPHTTLCILLAFFCVMFWGIFAFVVWEMVRTHNHGGTVKPLYKHIIGNRIRMLIREVCLYKGN